MYVISGGLSAERINGGLRVKDAAVYLNVTSKWVYEHVASGYLPCQRIGKMIRFTSAGLDEWLMSHVAGEPCDATLDGTPLIDSASLESHLSVSRTLGSPRLWGHAER